MILPLDSKGRLKWDSSGSIGRKSIMPSSSGAGGVFKEEEPVKTTPLVARSLGPESRPRNAKKVLWNIKKLLSNSAFMEHQQTFME